MDAPGGERTAGVHKAGSRASRRRKFGSEGEGILSGERTITLEELARNDGRNGSRAYIAFEGKVYDVTDNELWAGGDHFGGHEAGKDLTGEIDAAPHGPENLERVALVGVLASHQG